MEKIWIGGIDKGENGSDELSSTDAGKVGERHREEYS